MLRESDWTQISDYALVSEEEKALWAEYRQALRDLPETYQDPFTIVWPSKPEHIIIFTEPTQQIVQEPVVVFSEPEVTEEPILSFNSNSTSTSFSSDISTTFS